MLQNKTLVQRYLIRQVSLKRLWYQEKIVDIKYKKQKIKKVIIIWFYYISILITYYWNTFWSSLILALLISSIFQALIQNLSNLHFLMNIISDHYFKQSYPILKNLILHWFTINYITVIEFMLNVIRENNITFAEIEKLNSLVCHHNLKHLNCFKLENLLMTCFATH